MWAGVRAPCARPPGNRCSDGQRADDAAGELQHRRHGEDARRSTRVRARKSESRMPPAASATTRTPAASRSTRRTAAKAGAVDVGHPRGAGADRRLRPPHASASAGAKRQHLHLRRAAAASGPTARRGRPSARSDARGPVPVPCLRKCNDRSHVQSGENRCNPTAFARTCTGAAITDRSRGKRLL